MAFVWKENKDKFKGEGIYFLTFNVNNRVPILGKLKALTFPDAEGHIAMVEATELGNAVYREFNALQARYEGFHVVAKQIMEDHFHAVCWCKAEFGEQSIKMVARNFAQGCSKIARRVAMSSIDAQLNCAGINGKKDSTADINGKKESKKENTTNNAGNIYDCGNGANTLFEKPYIRTLSHAGQLRHMIEYTHSNPDNAWRRRLNPQLYVIRRGHEYAGLKFDVMGKERLLDYPDRQVIALSRSLSQEQIEQEVKKALWNAESGCITYTAAINEGEKRVARVVREAGYPLVIMMLDGFPPEGTDAARYFHPGGVYHKICGEGRLCLMTPHESCYDSTTLIQLSEQELAMKASQKGQHYTGMPHSTKRWRMIAGNMMLRMIAGEVE